MRRAAILIFALALVGCDGLPLGLLGGGGSGTSVAANIQAGKTNAQVVGRADFTEQRITAPAALSVEQSAGDTRVRTEKVETLIVNEGPPTWLIVAFLITWLIGWILPSPAAISAWASKKIFGE